MKRHFPLASVALISFALLSACSSDAEPAGQVVATVDGVEITQSELNAELGGIRGRNAEEQKALQSAALQGIVNRTLLANAAASQELDKSPEGAMTKRRAEQMALISLLEKSVVATTPTISPEEATEFVEENPGLFEQRRIFLVEQVAVNANSPKLLKDLEPLNTMAEVQAYLTSLKLPSQISFGVIDALQTDPEVTRQITTLEPNAVFVLPQGDTIRINRVRETQIVPITGDDAVSVAKEILSNQRRQQLLNSSISTLLEQGKAKVKYNAAFKPAAPPTKKAVPAE